MTQSSSESNSSAPLGAQQESLQQLDLLQGFPALRDALIPAAPEPVNVAAELEASGVPNPVARVRVDSTLPQVDRTFDYRVPAELSEDAVPGARVRVLFNGHELTGYIEERAATTDWTRTSLLPLKSVLSRVPSVAPEILRLPRRLLTVTLPRWRTCCAWRCRRVLPRWIRSTRPFCRVTSRRIWVILPR